MCDRSHVTELWLLTSTIRNEAQGLFWSDPDTWYLIEPFWLFDGGFLGIIFHDPDFLTRVKYVEIFGDLGEISALMNNLENRLDRQRKIEEEWAQNFWEAFQQRLPCATQVFLSRNSSCLPEFDAPREGHDSHELIAQRCPATVDVNVSVLENALHNHKLVEWTLWRCGSESWERINSVWSHTSILVPPKEFRGHVGRYQSIQYRKARMKLRESGFFAPLVAATGRHYFEGGCEPFICKKKACEAQFENADEWIVHAMAHGSCKNSYVPGPLKAMFREDEDELPREELEVGMELGALRSLGRKVIPRRRIAEKEFLDELEHDPLYRHMGLARECSMFKAFSKYLQLPKRV
ncbi:hypothetical protein BCR34DRAFT_607026 [Clohesyomyces aquaticus]|uniref:C2H2-type domain-containing protein n=1 Tax=Clohesyomyces aquaticus TaxID=1231657 RepID=A0A1Y1YJM9_9PLEO|nr:hypothetical protein BCR34DRAFT_607026 [Clohesyomyces aquaticus]